MDYELVVKCVHGVLSLVEIDSIAADCMSILCSLINSKVVNVKTGKNRVAHDLVGLTRNAGTIICNDLLSLQ
jgi:hypothetical protein